MCISFSCLIRGWYATAEYNEMSNPMSLPTIQFDPSWYTNPILYNVTDFFFLQSADIDNQILHQWQVQTIEPSPDGKYRQSNPPLMASTDNQSSTDGKYRQSNPPLMASTDNQILHQWQVQTIKSSTNGKYRQSNPPPMASIDNQILHRWQVQTIESSTDGKYRQSNPPPMASRDNRILHRWQVEKARSATCNYYRLQLQNNIQYLLHILCWDINCAHTESN